MDVDERVIEAVREASGGRWVSLRRIRRVYGVRLTISDVAKLARLGVVSAYLDLARGEVFVRYVEARRQPNGVELPQDVVERVRVEAREPVPKPTIVDLLKSLVGDSWEQVYGELIRRGVLSEIAFNGMTFVKAS